MTFLRNTWYAACWSADLKPDSPLAKTIVSDPLVIWRSADGALSVLADRCCHRSLPLSMGRIAGNHLQCGYHGLEFDTSGACVTVPGQTRVPPASAVRSYPVVERYNMIWVWPGDPAAADETMIPELPWLDDPCWTSAPGYLHLKADYRLLIDNLLDLTHVSYIHKNTIAGDPAEALVPVKTVREGNSIRVERWMLGFTAPPMYDQARKFDGKVDRWQLIRWMAPSTVILDIGCAEADTGAPEGDRSQGISMWSNHIITPETETTTHYHWCFSRNYKLDDTEVTRVLAEGGLQTFMEDVVILEEQQNAIERVGGRPVVDINIDNAPLQFRRILENLVADDYPGVAAE